MIDIQLTAHDYIGALQLHSRWSGGRWLRSGIVLVALLFYALWLGRNDPSFVFVVVGAYLAAMTVVFLVLRFALVPWQGRRIFGQTKMLQRPFHWSWDEEQLRYTNDLANVTVPWSDLVKWREGEDAFLVYPSNVTFYIFPKRVFANKAAIDDFRALLARNVTGQASPASVF